MQNLEELQKAQLELLSAAYSQAKAYFNLVIMGGYAAFFAIWALVRDELTSRQTLWSALLMSISLVTFIAWEIFQMVVSSRSLLSMARSASSPQAFAKYLATRQDQNHSEVSRLGIYWVAALVITVLFAGGASGILLYAFVTGLWGEYA